MSQNTAKTTTLHENNSVRTPAQELPVQLWTDATLVIDPDSKKNSCFKATYLMLHLFP